jgi:hypothetical protein
VESVLAIDSIECRNISSKKQKEKLIKSALQWRAVHFSYAICLIGLHCGQVSLKKHFAGWTRLNELKSKNEIFEK